MPSSGLNSGAGAPVGKALARFDKDSGEPLTIVKTGTIALVVEDDPDVRAIAATIIRGLGFDTLVSPNGDAALAIMESRGDIVLLFTDVVMPGRLNGIALAKAGMGLIPGLKVILTSGYNDEIFAGPKGHNFPLIRKPYRYQDLSEAVRGLIGPE